MTDDDKNDGNDGNDGNDRNDKDEEKKALIKKQQKKEKKKEKKIQQKKAATQAKDELEYFDSIDSNLSQDIKLHLENEKINERQQLQSVLTALSSAALSDSPVIIGSNYSFNDDNKEGIDFNKHFVPLLSGAYLMFLSPLNNMNSKGEASYKKFYDFISNDIEKNLKYLDQTQCERSIGILGTYATILRQRSDFIICSSVLDVDKVILDRYFELCRNDDSSDEVEKSRTISCLEGLKYKYLLIKFNLLKDSGAAGLFTVHDMQFMLKFESRKVLFGDYYIDEDEEDKRSLQNRSLARQPSQLLWGYREVIVYPSMNRDVFFRHVISLYGPNALEDHIDTEMPKWGSKQTIDNVTKGLTDKQVFEFQKNWILSLYESELSGSFPMGGVNHEVVSKHKFYKKYVHELSKMNFCHNTSCGKFAINTKDLMACPCNLAKYCDKVCHVAHWKKHKKVCTCKKE